MDKHQKALKISGGEPGWPVQKFGGIGEEHSFIALDDEGYLWASRTQNDMSRDLSLIKCWSWSDTSMEWEAGTFGAYDE